MAQINKPVQGEVSVEDNQLVNLLESAKGLGIKVAIPLKFFKNELEGFVTFPVYLPVRTIFFPISLF